MKKLLFNTFILLSVCLFGGEYKGIYALRHNTGDETDQIVPLNSRGYEAAYLEFLGKLIQRTEGTAFFVVDYSSVSMKFLMAQKWVKEGLTDDAVIAKIDGFTENFNFSKGGDIKEYRDAIFGLFTAVKEAAEKGRTLRVVLPWKLYNYELNLDEAMAANLKEGEEVKIINGKGKKGRKTFSTVLPNIGSEAAPLVGKVGFFEKRQKDGVLCSYKVGVSHGGNTFSKIYEEVKPTLDALKPNFVRSGKRAKELF